MGSAPPPGPAGLPLPFTSRSMMQRARGTAPARPPPFHCVLSVIDTHHANAMSHRGRRPAPTAAVLANHTVRGVRMAFVLLILRSSKVRIQKLKHNTCIPISSSEKSGKPLSG